MNTVQTCPLEQCSNLSHVQTRNTTPCYNKEGIITEYTPKHKIQDTIVYNDTTKLTSTNTMQTRIAKKLKLKKKYCVNNPVFVTSPTPD